MLASCHGADLGVVCHAPDVETGSVFQHDYRSEGDDLHDDVELMTGRRIVVIGEGMLELAGTADQARLGYGGDALNTAIHLARFGLPTSFLTALGRDPFSSRLKSDWAREGLDTGLILTDPERQPGLYAIHTDPSGERSFTYWRDQSAARRMFELEGTQQAIQQACQAELLYFSLIGLAILPASGRQQLLDLARAVRDRGGRVAFDGNYRPSLWPHPAEASEMRDAALSVCDIGLPSLADEQALSGFGTADAVTDHWRSLGTREVVVKQGEAGAVVDGLSVPPPTPVSAIDTTGAGDAFNAAYLAARLAGKPPAEAALVGHQLGGWVVTRRGAIPPVDEQAPYEALA